MCYIASGGPRFATPLDHFLYLKNYANLLPFTNSAHRWRVLEISDIIMIIVDIRHPVIHFPPSLYHYVVNEMKRKLVVVFNKVHHDLQIGTIG